MTDHEKPQVSKVARPGAPGFRAYAYQELGPVRVNEWDVLKLKFREVESYSS